MDLKHVNSERSWEWHKTFIGQYMQHNYWLYYILDDIIGNNSQIMSIIEIGTGRGALTTVLGLYGIKKNVLVFTVDINSKFSQPMQPVFKALNIQFYTGDSFSDAIICKIDSIINNQPTYIICDGGNKIKEFNFWTPKIPIGSIISAHDWSVEISMNHIKDTVDKYLQPYKPEKWTEMNIQFATFKKMK
jgi:hypothetical protein